MGVFQRCKPLLGVVHLPPLPGSTGYKARRYPPRLGKVWSLEEIIEYAVSEASVYEDAGFDGVILENYGDTPYPKTPGPLQVSAMTRIVREVSSAVGIPVGVNMLRNGSVEALASAYSGGGSFIRVNSLCETRLSPEGILEPDAARLAKSLALLGILEERRIEILADVDVKHSQPLVETSIAQTVRDCIERSGVPIAGVVLTGHATGGAPDADEVVAAARTASEYEVKTVVGSGVSQLNLSKYWHIADGFIIGSSIKLGGKPWNPIDKEKARLIASLAERLRRITEGC
ncbi:BtpA homolog [Aeropyrum pernix K1]|uniref:BtpA homolog n=1 Tax=Aeropyrum pernix (strain ATCC 700893 / DSM 11879 / JCM 9820 / NBRC 100138 / K1) TaxID=272557 RepID=Q9Y937_AERPE|nr:BtpA/SgcQ family protein [Aeropyrum pernix]BAA81463.1 BtpA homolog [Aeropyrum pernix K1]